MSRISLLSLMSVGAMAGALVLPCVDNRGSDVLAGFGVRGYQCFAGLFLMPLVVPWASPLWIALAIGNVQVVWQPVRALWPSPAPSRLARWSHVISLVGIVVIAVSPLTFTITRVHAGYWLWGASHLLACVASWQRQSQPSRRWPSDGDA